MRGLNSALLFKLVRSTPFALMTLSRANILNRFFAAVLGCLQSERLISVL